MNTEKTITPRKKQALETKKKIFETSITLFAKKAYEEITIQDICKEAGVSVGAFYHHFKSKADIIDVGYKLFDQQTEENFETATCSTPLEVIRFLLTEQTHSMEKLGVPACTQFFKTQLSCGEKYVLDTERFFYRTLYKNIEKALALNLLSGEPLTITNDILSSSRGLIYDWCLHEGHFSLTERSQKMLDIVWSYYSV